VTRGLKANEWVSEVQDLMEGKGGGKELSAQATGTNIRCLSRAVELTKEYAARKLNLVSKQSNSTHSASVKLAALNDYLADHSYISGYQASQSDTTIFKAIGSTAPAAAFVHLLRWYNHLRSYSASEIEKFPGSRLSVEQLGYGAVEEKKAADDDEDFELFGEDDDDAAERERLKEERVRMYEEKKQKKAVVIAKSNIILDVKPWDDETDMDEIERRVRAIETDGLLWGASKFVPLAYGIRKLQITCVVEDDKVGTDFLEEEITKHEDLVQSVDIAAFNKI